MSRSDAGPGPSVESLASDGFTAGDFATFFKDVHGCDPFPWQRRLTAQVLDGRGWPRVVDLPTGAGKTAVLDTAVFAMAAQPATSPRRIVFVIDRRIVVDQVYKRAQRIRDRVRDADTPVLRFVRERLQAMSDVSDGNVLGIAALRGGIPIDADWTGRPDQPWVMVSTVDQFGSRLLFRGYGVTPSMRPIHAGLTGNDCLVILDEVHLSVPFAETLAQVAAVHSGPLPRRFEVVEMSATPSDESAERFTLDSETDLDGCPELRRRVRAAKRAELVPVRDHKAVPAAVLKIVKSIDKSVRKNDSRIRSVGVVVNRVRTARETHDALASAGYPSHLMTGRMRPFDRVDALERIVPIVDPDGGQRGDELSIVVATQAIEVGADFSFDALVTECAAVDSLRQRFGRLDRRGTWSEQTDSPAQAWIIGPKSVVGSRKPDPIYGGATKATWEELERRAREGPLDTGPVALRDFPDDAIAPRERAPLLLGTHLDAWVQTCPEPIVQPRVDWFLHGIDEEPPADVSILWRWDRSTEALRAVPPRQTEFIQVPIAAARSWLTRGPEVEIADVGQGFGPDDSHFRAKSSTKYWVRWGGFGDGARDVEVRDIRPGDILVVDPRRGGLNAGTWDPASNESVEDLGDAAQIEHGRKATLRLDSRLSCIGSPPTPVDEAEAATSVKERVGDWLEVQSTEMDRKPAWMQQAIRTLMKSFEVVTVGIDDERPSSGYYILIACDQSTGKPVVDAAALDGSDEAGSHTGTGVSLERHLKGVGERAGDIAERLGLPPNTVSDLRLAGRLHDLGKVDPRFQLQLVGGDPVEMEMRRGAPLAKSLPGARRVRSYPTGMRHELASVAMIQSNDEVLASACDKDLVLHLVGTHHGWGRPLPPIIEDSEPQVLTYALDGQLMKVSSELAESSLALDMADRFWRLVEHYGYHGLAWLEAILRLSDHQQSAEEARRT